MLNSSIRSCVNLSRYRCSLSFWMDLQYYEGSFDKNNQNFVIFYLKKCLFNLTIGKPTDNKAADFRVIH